MSHRSISAVILSGAILVLFFVYPEGINKFITKVNIKVLEKVSFKIPYVPVITPFRLGLDLLGGTHLVYQANLSSIQGQTTTDAMDGVRDVIERRVNLFGVAEPLVQIEGKDRLVVELAGIKDVQQAIALIGQTPFLQFWEPRPQTETDAILEAQKNNQRLDVNAYFVATELDGKYLKRSQIAFDQQSITPQVSIEFNEQGAKIFGEITKRNLGKPVVIFLDGVPISSPVVQSEITNGKAVITGRFTPQEAKDLANRLNAGALPVPITLVSQQTIGPSLGQQSLDKSLRAGLYGLFFVSIFMILFYRIPGVISVLALFIYVLIVLAIYKLIPVTITLAGMAGFILSLGIAVDANVLIFARMREELKAGKNLRQAFQEGFNRAWFSIRDSHVTTLLGALVLYIFTTSVAKGFALTLGIGVLLSLFSAVVVTRILLLNFARPWFENKRWLF